MKIIWVEKQSILIQEVMSGGHCEGLKGTIAETIRRLALAGGAKITVCREDMHFVVVGGETNGY